MSALDKTPHPKHAEARLMPGAVKVAEGPVVLVVRDHDTLTAFYDVEGLQPILENWHGKRVSIIVEEVAD